MPTGKQNTFANRTVPEAVVVAVREDQPVSLVGAFEEAVPADAARGYVARSVEALARHAATIEDNYGLEDYDALVAKMNDLGMDTTEYEFYLDLRKYGTVPHGGFGIGIERMVTFVAGTKHIREAIPFPRMLHSLDRKSVV